MRQDGILLSEIAKLVEAELLGSPDIKIFSISPFNEMRDGCLSFTSRKQERSWSAIGSKIKVGALIVETTTTLQASEGVALLKVGDPLKAVARVAFEYFSVPRPEPGISKNADVHPSAEIGQRVHIGAFCSVGAGAKIGDDAVLYPHVVLYQNVQVGARSILHAGAVIREECLIGADSVIQSGAVIGAEGFGYFVDPVKGIQAVPQIGNVVLKDRVDVGANACVDRATFGTTQIGTRTKIDNLVQIGHNVKVGTDSFICGLAGIAGSTTLGNQIVIGGCVGVADHLNIGDKIRVGGQAGVINDLVEPGDYLGYPAIPAKTWHRQTKALRDLLNLTKQTRKSSDKRK